MTFPRILPVGDSAVTLELGDAIEPAQNARVRAVDESLREHPFRGLLETVPSYRALLVLYDSGALNFSAVEAALRERLARRAAPSPPTRLVTVPTRYGGDDGPDLPDVARTTGLREGDVVALHAGTEYSAFMLGFMPGFAYLGLVPESLETARRATPRTRVPAGSVALAGRQTGIYPGTSPGGWNLIGRTAVRLFDAFREPPSLISPGDRVCFVPVPELAPAEPAQVATPPTGMPAVIVEEAGLLTTVQDGGRPGFRRLGVSASGPMDRNAHDLANRLVGNPTSAAALECTMSGPALRFLRPVHFAVTGADLGAVLHRHDLGLWTVPQGTPVFAREGNVLAFSGRQSGCRATVSFAGGIDVAFVLGSRATDLSGAFGGFGGRSLRSGDVIPLGRPAAIPTRLGPSARPLPGDSVAVRVVLGPQDGGAAARSAFLGQTWTVAATSDRVGLRLGGAPLPWSGPRETISDGMVPGCIQVPPDGLPIVMTADGPTTGGYPKIATVISADQPLLGQAVPGLTRLRFEAITVSEAQAILRRDDAARWSH